MKHIKYSPEAVNLIAERMPDEFLKQFVMLWLGTDKTVEQLAEHFNYSTRQMERYASKVKKLISQMPDISNGEVKNMGYVSMVDGHIDMTIFDFAEELNGREYGNEITRFEEQRANELGFVVVFGYSDDNAEFRGAIYDEIGCYDGGRIFEENGKYIDALWGESEYCWTYNTNIPHATFDIYEDKEKYCKGIVFKRSDTE